jgi:hypothetical protein
MREVSIVAIVAVVALSVLLAAFMLQSKQDQRTMIQLRETIQQQEIRIAVYEELFGDLKPIRMPMPHETIWETL